MNSLLVVMSLIASNSALAADLSVTRGSGRFYEMTISAKQVVGVNVQLVQEITRDDCNRRSIMVDKARVSGNVVNWYATYAFTAGTMMTEMHCPGPSITETIKSPIIFFESYTNPNIDREVLINLIVPEGYELEVSEVI